MQPLVAARDLCVICERPMAIRWDQEGRLHDSTRPAVEFRDGRGDLRVARHLGSRLVDYQPRASTQRSRSPGPTSSSGARPPRWSAGGACSRGSTRAPSTGTPIR